jgi:hypothetical protein
MSELSKALGDVHPLGHDKVRRLSHATVAMVHGGFLGAQLVPAHQQVFRLEAIFRADVVLAELDNGGYVVPLDDLRRHVIEGVFGEFRPMLRELQQALWLQETASALSVLGRLERQMFDCPHLIGQAPPTVTGT